MLAASARAERAEPAVVELGHVLTGDAGGRYSDDDVVTYLSAGLGVQDAAAAWSVYQRAEAHDVGRGLGPTHPDPAPSHSGCSTRPFSGSHCS
ncbi:hypothetical protein [Streptomyces sp. SAS_270]|uniref:hypothetical protein n=1 Tax=Streptomyces sp. SAS_270 TaxID=3412748 RepID=UPI00403C6A47